MQGRSESTDFQSVKKEKSILIPENYYGVSEDNVFILFPDMITCTGICITNYDKKKIFVHYADLPGYPSKVVTDYKHPLPSDLQAFQRNSASLFTFLLNELGIQNSNQIKNVAIFGNFRVRTDIFDTTKRHLSQQDVKQIVSSMLSIPVEKIQVLTCREVDVLVNLNGEASVFYQSDIIDKISDENYQFYEKQDEKLSKETILSNFHFFNSHKQPKKFFVDDMDVRYRN